MAHAAPSSSVPHPSLPPSVAPRVGTLDDDVAAMLALRSDIQEQALSELSQLSAYRPAAVGGQAERLTKRVPTAMPAAAPGPEESAAPVQRDADRAALAPLELPVGHLSRPSRRGRPGGSEQHHTVNHPTVASTTETSDPAVFDCTSKEEV